jgi:hypothetical protein
MNAALSLGNLKSQGLAGVVTPQALAMATAEADRVRAEAEDAPGSGELDQLAGYIRTQFEMMRNHRSSARGWNDRLLHAQRVFNGQYDTAKLAQIKQFGGSDVYARVTAVKCRGASALLRDIYLAGERAWGLDPTPEPSLPENIADAVKRLVEVEVMNLMRSGQQVSPEQVKDRITALTTAATRAAKKKAREEAKKAEDKLDDILTEGGFYKAFAEFLVDLPLFPFACIKGPVVRIVPTVTWAGGAATIENRPRMFWNRVSPFDIYFTPGVSDIEDAQVIEKLRYTRADLNDLLGLPGYNEAAIRKVLNEYAHGINDWLDPTDSERADGESRENPWLNRSELISALEFHGNVQGKMLLEYGMDAAQIPDPDRDYFVQAWVIGRHVIKVQLSPSPRKRHPYYITSFERVPGTPVGNALPDILEDVQNVCNATLRALVNNLSISSGPQVVVDDDLVTPGHNNDELYPWKRWHISRDPGAANNGSVRPVDFFQPASNAAELLGVYEKFTQIADELSAIPRYATGSERLGGAGRTASGLAMLMGNASKVLQNVAGNIDRDVVSPLLQSLYDMVMLTDQTGLFRGDESIRVRGVAVAMQRETNRQRQLEFLQTTANPIDMEIMGIRGRAAVLRSVSNELGMEGESIIPADDELEAQQQAKQQQMAQMAQMQLQMGGEENAPGGPPKGVSNPPAPANTDLGVQEARSMRGVA